VPGIAIRRFLIKMPMPRLSVIVVVHNMRREAPRTLHSLSPVYQQGISEADYEIIVVENGSSSCLSPQLVEAIAPNFRYMSLGADARPSPARAINAGVQAAAAEAVGIMIDGARLVTPGVLRHAMLALSLSDRAVVSTLAFHLGPAMQNVSMTAGYGPAAEDGLLDQIAWPSDGYRLFEVAALAGSSEDGWFLPVAESNCLFLSKAMYRDVGGYSEAFQFPGGGMVNLDFYRRVCDQTDTQLITLLGEGTFHQFHNGIMTNRPAADMHAMWQEYEREYVRIRGVPFAKPTRPATYFGSLPVPAVPWLERSVRAALGAVKPPS
jgi:glycosyltransferase involved in cell wall biosynthesis